MMYWQGHNRILRYLKGMVDYGLYYTLGLKMEISTCTDADWAADKDNRRSTRGYCIILAANCCIIELKETKCNVKLQALRLNIKPYQIMLQK